MKSMRNREVQRQLAASLLLLIVWTAACGLLFSVPAAGFLALFGLSLTGIWVIFTEKRYRSLKRLAGDTDRLLHGERHLNLDQYREGELSVLANEMQKLLFRLTQQSDVLQREKEYLSDSMADISHQLRTPLTSLHLLLTRLQGEQEESARRRLAYEGGRLLGRIDWLVDALLKISKIDAGTAVFGKEWVDASALVDKALEPFGISMELREQKAVKEIGENAGFLGDFAWTAEALGNILKNCLDQTGQGGTVFLRAGENELYTEFVIEDDGPGIDPEDLPHLFERFYKGKNASDSSVGIGLALSRMILWAQNGTLKAENRPERGARFIMRFYKGIV